MRPAGSNRPAVAVVVPTRNRPHLLEQLLATLSDQILSPCCVVVVDSSDEENRSAVERALSRAPLPGKYLFSERPSIPGQRNCGVDWLLEHRSEATLVQFMDDDVVPRPDYMLRLADLLTRDTVGGIAGASGISLDRSSPRNRAVATYHRMFGLRSNRAGALLPGGHNMPVPVPTESDEVAEVEWLFGCSMWRLPIFRTTRFSEAMPGGALFEDVEFSVRARRHGRLVVDTAARLDHALAPEGRADARTHHRRWVRNRFAVVTAMGRDGSKFWFWWSTFGYFLAIARHTLNNPEFRQAALGVIDGSADVLRRRPMT